MRPQRLRTAAAISLARVTLAQYALLIRLLRRATRDALWSLYRHPLRLGSFGQCAAQLLHCSDLESTPTSPEPATPALHNASLPRFLPEGS